MTIGAAIRLDAFGYYARAVLRNKLRGTLGKLAVPRYLIGTVIVVLLFSSVVGQIWALALRFDLRPWLTLFIGLQIAEIWISLPMSRPGTRFHRGLAFRQSEVELLFPAPLARRSLTVFKLLQRGGPVLTTASVYSVLSVGTPDVSLPRLFLGWALAVNVIGLHALLLHTAGRRLAHTRFARVPWVLSAAAVLSIALLVWLAFVQSASEFGSALLVTPVGKLLMWPASSLLAPAYSASWLQFAGALWFPLLLWIAHVGALVAWSPRVEDVPGPSGNRVEVASGRGRWTLAPAGPVWRAVAWKNVVAISRRHAWLGRALLVILPVLVLVVRFAPEDYYVLGQFLTVLSFFVFVGYAALVAPSTKIAGMRLDIPHFALLKSMPISGRQLMVGEVMGPFCVIYGAVLLAYLVWVVAYTGTEGMPIDSLAKLKVAIVILPFMAGWIFIQITIRNLMLLYFPAFAGFDATRQDYDKTGQKLLGYVVHMLVLLLFAVPAAIVGAIVFDVQYVLLDGDRFVSAVVAMNVGSLALFAEALILIHYSRGRYADFDIPAER